MCRRVYLKSKSNFGLNKSGRLFVIKDKVCKRWKENYNMVIWDERKALGKGTLRSDAMRMKYVWMRGRH